MYDDLETRSQDAREAAQLTQLNALLGEALPDIGALSGLPVLRKSDLVETQMANPPFGTVPVKNAKRLFQSPGPIYEPGGATPDWWRMGRFLHALGVGEKDVAQNTFSYHFTPAGAMFDSGADAVGAAVIAAGPGQTEMQVQVASHFGTTTYVGTPDYLRVILEKADAMGVTLGINKAAVSAGPLFPALRDGYAERGITCRQCYGTADAGLISYETEALEGMVIDENVIVEIVTPGTGTPVAMGEVGELLVTVLNPDYPLIRFATGDLSALMPGQSPCGRTNARIVGWRGRADQAAKVKGMFVRPEQVAKVLEHHPEIDRARLEVALDDGFDKLLLKVEGDTDSAALAKTFTDVTRLKANVEVVAQGSLPRDGVVIADLRPVES